MPTSPYAAILFDLDGTLTDPFEGILRSVAYALEHLNHPMPTPDELREWIGPPLHDSFLALLGDSALAEAGVRRYRERYLTVGMLENRLYDGIPELLGELRAAGTRLFVATSKIRQPSEAILAHFDLARHFEYVSAPDPSDNAHKAEVIARLRPHLGADWERAVMVGDTRFDVEGARVNGLDCIAVGYGYGSPASLLAAEPLALVESVVALRGVLLR